MPRPKFSSPRLLGISQETARLLNLKTILLDKVPTLGEFAVAVGEPNIWKHRYPFDAIRKAKELGLNIPYDWSSLAYAAWEVFRPQDIKQIPSENKRVILEALNRAIRSKEPAIAWSGWYVTVAMHRKMPRHFNRIGGDMKGPMTALIDAVDNLPLPQALPGAIFECRLLEISIEQLRITLWLKGRDPRELRLSDMLDASQKAAKLLQAHSPAWYPSHAFPLHTVEKELGYFATQIQQGIVKNGPRMLSLETSILFHLEGLHDFAIWLAKLLPDSAYYDSNAWTAQKKQALKFAGMWAISAWEALREIRARTENGMGECGCRPDNSIPINKAEIRALDLAIKRFLAAGREPTAAALASLLTSYKQIDRDLQVSDGLENVSDASKEALYRRIRTNYGSVIRQLGYEVFGCGAPATPEAAQLDDKYKRRREKRPPVEVLQELHDEVAYSEGAVERHWLDLSSSLSTLPNLGQTVALRKFKLIKVLYYLARGRNDKVADLLDGRGVPVDAAIAEFASDREKLIPLMFEILAERWKLRWAARLLSLPGGGLNADHLNRFLSQWEYAIALGAVFVARETEFHELVGRAFSENFNALDENVLFRGLELLHNPTLTLVDRKRIGPHELFDLWREQNVNVLAEDGRSTHSRLGLTHGGAFRQRPVVRIPTIQELVACLEGIENRTNRSVLYISFVATSGSNSPELLGMALRTDHSTPRWRQRLNSDSLLKDTQNYLAELGVEVRCGGIPSKLSVKSPLAVLANGIWNQLRTAPMQNEVVVISGPPELNGLPWRWLLRSTRPTPGSKVPSVFVVPSASWLVDSKLDPVKESIKVRQGHGSRVVNAAGFSTTASGQSAPDTIDRTSAIDFKALRKLCNNFNCVVDNRCFGGHTERYRTCEWGGNPSMLLITPCRLFVGPPCEIPVSTADRLAKRLGLLNAGPLNLIGVIDILDSLAAADPAAWLYNAYGAP